MRYVLYLVGVIVMTFMLTHISNPPITKGPHMKEVMIFKAPWCGPCKAYAPIIEEARAEIEAKGYLITIVDVDANPDVATAFNVRSIPTTVVIQEDGTTETVVGMKSKEELLGLLK